MLMRATTYVQVLHGLFYVLLQMLVVAAIILSFKVHFKFYRKFYCSCDPSFGSYTKQTSLTAMILYDTIYDLHMKTDRNCQFSLDLDLWIVTLMMLNIFA